MVIQHGINCRQLFRVSRQSRVICRHTSLIDPGKYKAARSQRLSLWDATFQMTVRNECIHDKAVDNFQEHRLPRTA